MAERSKRFVLFLSCALLAPTAPAGAGEGRTTREMSVLSPRVANRVAQRDLLSVLKPVETLRSSQSRRLHTIGFDTRPYGTEYAGLCRHDTIWLNYAATGAAGDGKLEDVPVEPHGVETTAWFHLARLPAGEPRDDEDDRHVRQSVCRGLDGDDVRWFVAKDARKAAQGAIVLARAIAAVKAGTLKALPCPDVSDGKRSCEDIIVETGDPSGINSIETCAAAAGTLCYAIDLNASTRLTIVAAGNFAELEPRAIVSIAVEQYIIVT